MYKVKTIWVNTDGDADDALEKKLNTLDGTIIYLEKIREEEGEEDGYGKGVEYRVILTPTTKV